MSAIAMLVLALLLGGGVSAAANYAKPGDALYPMKINLNEKLRVGLEVSEQGKAEADAMLAERRLEEAEDIAAKSELNADDKDQLEQNFKEHADMVEARVKKFKDRDQSAASDIIGNFKSALSAHGRILSAVAAASKSDAEKLAVGSLNQEVKNEYDQSSALESDVHSRLQGNGPEVKAAAQGKLEAALNNIDEATRMLQHLEGRVSGDTNAKARARLEEAKKAVAAGKAQLASGNYVAAFQSFNEAQQTASQVQLIVQAQSNLNESDSEEGADTEIDLKDGAHDEAEVKTNINVHINP